jgi:response regulator RpfG family c-di-GMP phosphodiesterase
MTHKILCVDDDEVTLKAYRGMHQHLLSKGRDFLLETCSSPEQALAMVTGQGPYAVVISDMQMPSMDGIQFLRWVKEIAPETVRMMVTGIAVFQVAVDALHEGSVFRFLTKPCTLETFGRAIEAGIHQYTLIRAEKELLEKTLTGCIEVLTGALALVNPTAFGRAARVRQRVKQLAEQLKSDNVWRLEMAAMLSQSGCITVPEEIIGRVYRGADLEPHEWNMFADHPRIGHDLISRIPRLEPVALAIAYQEKHYDGTGIPEDDVRGSDIPLAARVLKVALDFDTLESQGLSGTAALESMKRRPGWYDPAVLDALRIVLQDDVDLTRKDVTVKWLLEQLNAGLEGQPLLGRIILADNVCTTNNVMVLSKGHEITIAFLERLRNFSRHADIREPIRIWVPVRK